MQAPVVPPPMFRTRALTITERNALFAVLLVVAGILVFTAIRGAEMSIGRWADNLRFVRNPAEAAMRYLGIAHFLLAFVYMLTSKRTHSRRGWTRTILFAIFGIIAAGLFVQLRILNAYLASVVLFVIFVFHDFGDQVRFYFVNGDATLPVGSDVERFIFWSSFAVTALPIALIAAGATGGMVGAASVRSVMTGSSVVFRAAAVIVTAAFIMLSVAQAIRCARRISTEQRRHILRDYRPLYTVIAGELMLVAIAEAFHSGAQALITFHVTAWYVFVLRNLMRQRNDMKKSTGEWLRGTPAGFTLLHAGILLIAIAGGVFWAYAQNNSPQSWLAPLLAASSFQVVTAFHVTLSLSSR